MSQVEQALNVEEELPLSVLLRVGSRSFAFILRAVALQLTKDRHDFLCGTDEVRAAVSAKAARRMGDLQQWGRLWIKRQMLENVPVLQLATSLVWHDAAVYYDWTRAFCRSGGTDYTIDQEILAEALEEIKLKKVRDAFYKAPLRQAAAKKNAPNAELASTGSTPENEDLFNEVLLLHLENEVGLFLDDSRYSAMLSHRHTSMY